MGRALAAAVLVLFGVCVVVACWEVSPLAAALGLLAYGAVLAAGRHRVGAAGR